MYTQSNALVPFSSITNFKSLFVSLPLSSHTGRVYCLYEMQSLKSLPFPLHFDSFCWSSFFSAQCLVAFSMCCALAWLCYGTAIEKEKKKDVKIEWRDKNVVEGLYLISHRCYMILHFLWKFMIWCGTGWGPLWWFCEDLVYAEFMIIWH